MYKASVGDNLMHEGIGDDTGNNAQEFRKASTDSDRTNLQEDLAMLAAWSRKWTHNVSKCSIACLDIKILSTVSDV